MTRRSARAVLVLAAAFALAVAPAIVVQAADVEPTEETGNPTCAEVLEAPSDEVKFDPPTSGTQGGVTMTRTDDEGGQSFSFTSERPVLAVIVKGGSTEQETNGPQSSAAVYDYTRTEEGSTYADSGLRTFTGQGISHISFCLGNAPLTVDVQAQGTYQVPASWSLEKTVDGVENVDRAGTAGNTTDPVTWSVEVDRTDGPPQGHAFSGSATIGNVNPADLDATVTATLDGEELAIDCDSGTAGAQGATTVPGDGERVCTFSGAQDGDDVQVTVTPDDDAYEGGADSASVEWTAEPTGPQSVTVDDDREGGPDQTVVQGDRTFTYGEAFVCPADTGQYVDGLLTFTVTNTATIAELGMSDDAGVDVVCTSTGPAPSALSVEVEAEGTYQVPASWSLEKTVDGGETAELSGTQGGSAGSVTWAVVVDRTDGPPQGHAFSGTATVSNPNAEDVDVTVAATLDGAPLPVDCDPATDGAQQATTVPGEGSAECTFAGAEDGDVVEVTASPEDATYPGDTDAAEIEWTAEPTGPQSVTVDDDRDGGPDRTEVSGDRTFSYDEAFVCPADIGQYEEGMFEYGVTNTATIAELELSDDASVEVTCTAAAAQQGGLDVVKEVAGTSDAVVNPGDSISYELVVTATGDVGQTDVVVTDYVPGRDPAAPESGSTTYVAGSAGCDATGPCTASYDDATGLVTWRLGALASGASRTVGFTVTVDDPPGSAPVDDVLNAGAVESDQTPSEPSNQVRTPVTEVSPTVLTPPTDPGGPGQPVRPRVQPAALDRPAVLPFTGAWLLPIAALGGTSTALGVLAMRLAAPRSRKH